MQDHRDTPPYSGSDTPDIKSTASTSPDPATPNSLDTSAPGDAPQTLNIPKILTQDIVDADPHLKRVQQDLLLLTGFNDNETLYWRPSWFPQDAHAGQYWTLHNPPNVVTELLPHDSSSEYPGRVYTRRMRQLEDPPARYIKDWSHWHRVCDLMGVPHDFLSEEHVQLLRLGLLRDEQGALISPPTWPLYPEPQRPGQEPYALNPRRYKSHLPSKFHALITEEAGSGFVEQVEVAEDGRLRVRERGEYVTRGADRRWSWVPWTREQEESCRSLKVGVRGWNAVVGDGEARK